MQIFAVVVGILLALFINSWVTRRQQQTAVAEAMHAMRAEVSSNRTFLRTQTQLLFNMAQAMMNGPANRNQPAKPCMEWQGWSGVGASHLTEAAYQTAMVTQALANMPFKQAQLIAQVYGWQHVFQKFSGLETGLLLQHPQTLQFCVDTIVDIGHNNLQLDAAYSYLIGPDRHPLPKPPSPEPATSSPARGHQHGPQS